MNAVLEKLPLIYRLKQIDLMTPRAVVRIETDRYVVETVSDPDELKEIFKLRYDVFFREFAGRGDRFTFLPMDMDLHDFACDHLVVREKATSSIVATYRLMLEREGENRPFYSESVFDLSGLKKLSGIKLELGRACVHKDYRSGLVISLLWKGLCSYARKTGTKYMFGCSSISRSEFFDFPYIVSELRNRNAFLEVGVDVRPGFSLSEFPEIKLPSEVSPDHQKMPSLLNMYLLTGAKVATQPAYDREMDCLDLFTIMDFTNLPASFKRRFA